MPRQIPTKRENVDVEGDMLTTAEAARLLGLAQSTLSKWRVKRKGPRFFKLGHAVRYLQSDIDAFLTSRAKLSNRKPRGKSS